MSVPHFKIMLDENGKNGLYRRIVPNTPGAMAGWERIADEADFPKILEELRRPTK